MSLLVPVFVPGEHPNVSPRSGFRSRGTSAQTTLLETTLLSTLSLRFLARFPLASLRETEREREREREGGERARASEPRWCSYICTC